MSSLKHSVQLQAANVVAFIITIIINALDRISPLNGKTTGEISDLYSNLFTPPGYVFLIWFVIYVLQLVFVVFQALPKQRGKNFLSKIGYLFALSSILNVLWLFLWHYEQIVLSTIPMFALLGTLIAIYLRLQIGRSGVSLGERLAVHLHFSVYLGWITVATIGNVAAALTAINWDGWGISEVNWTILVIIVAAVITLAVVITRRDIAYSLVIVWAFTGIIVKQSENQILVSTAGACIAVILIALAVRIISKRF